MMKEKPYRINGDLWSDIPAVVKIEYGNKYVIAKCKKQASSLKSIENSLNAFIRGGTNNPNGIYFHLFNYVKKNPKNEFKVTTLLTSDNIFELLKLEQYELENGKNNPHFLNNQVDAYVPEYDYDTKSFGWMPQNAVLNFRKWLKATKKERQQVLKQGKSNAA